MNGQSRQCGSNRRRTSSKRMRTSTRMIIALAVPDNTTTEGGQSGTERTLKEIKLALQRMAIPVSYLFRIGAHLIEQSSPVCPASRPNSPPP